MALTTLEIAGITAGVVVVGLGVQHYLTRDDGTGDAGATTEPRGSWIQAGIGLVRNSIPKSTIYTVETSNVGTALHAGGVNIAGNGVMPNDIELGYLRAKYGASRLANLNIVPRVQTPFTNYNRTPQGGYDLRGLIADLVSAGCPGGATGATVCSVLVSIETWGGVNSPARIACYNFNPGNHKIGGSYVGDCWFIRDNSGIAGSYDLYPSSPDWPSGLAAELALLSNGNYNRAGETGATQAMTNGSLSDFNAALGAGGYASSYRTPNFMRARANRLIRLGCFDAGVITV